MFAAYMFMLFINGAFMCPPVLNTVELLGFKFTIDILFECKLDVGTDFVFVV